MRHLLARFVKPPTRIESFRTKSSLLSLAAVVATLSVSMPAKAAEPADTVLKAGTLFIEAEDFNFGKGQWINNQPIGMTGAYEGGLYQDLGDGLGGALCDGSDLGIDFNDNGTSDQAIYRPGTPVEAGKPNGPAGLGRGPFDVTVNHVVGWTGGGEWMNYTRRFPEPAKVYKVYARMAHGDAAQRRGGELSVVTSDPTKCDQTVQVLGSFDAPWTGGWDTWPDAGTDQDALVPMRDAAGAEALVKLSGLTTVRWTFRGGSGDLDYIAFVATASAGLPPKVLSLSPANNSTGTTDLPNVLAMIQDGDVEKVISASLKVDGAAVTATVTKTGAVTTVSYTVPKAFVAGSSHTVTLTYTDNATPPVTRTADSTFRVSFTPFRADTLFIEAEDFNFGKGQWVANKAIGMTGPYDGGDYMGKGDGLDGTDCDGSDFGIDYVESAASNAQAIYRATTGVEAGKPNGPAGVGRGTFDVKINHTVGWNDAGDWYNYTRVFPTNSYKVYARMATGGQDRHAQLDLVTGDPTKCNQTLQLLGNFDGPTTGGWDTWPDAGTPGDALVPLRDASGADAVVKLGGTQTIRFTTLPGNLDIDYLALMPLGAAPVITSLVPAPVLGIGASAASDTTSIKVSIEDSVQKAVSASLKLDGVAVNATVTKTNTTTRLSFTPAQPFAGGSLHTATLIYTDNATPPVVRTQEWSFRVSVLLAKSLFIEAEDFNFGHGQWVNNAPIGMTGAYPGGDYMDRGDGLNGADCDGSDFGIDFNDNATSDQAIYRATTPVEAGKLNGPAGFSRGTFDVTANHVVGWTGDGEWMNYTRKFPEPAQVYKVYARMAHGDAAQQRGGELSLVTSDPTKCPQTNQVLGTFAAPWTGGWDTWPDAGTTQDALVPMRDASGADTLVRLGGTNTLRWTFRLGAGDLDYLVFVPTGSSGLPPKVASLWPVNNSSGISDQPTIVAQIQDGEVEKIVSASLKVNGAAVTATVTKIGAITRVSYTPATPFAAGSSNTFTVSYTDSATPPVTRTSDGTFRVSFVPFRSNTLFIEAEDFNFGKGQWVNNKPIGMTGPYPGGDYAGLGNGINGTLGDGTDFGIDYFEAPASSDQAIYRPQTGVEAGKTNGPAGFNRGTFDVTVNHVVGWNNETEWYNYTRIFPTNTYKVYARTATDVGQTRNTSLSRVTSDPSKADQTVTVLGTFNGASTGGWDTWPDAGTAADALLPLKDTSGNPVVLSLGGLVTLRYTFLPGASDVDYLAFLPAPEAGPKFTGFRRNANGSITLEWTGGGVLEAAATVSGPWVPITGAASPYTFTPAAGQPILFGRLRQ